MSWSRRTRSKRSAMRKTRIMKRILREDAQYATDPQFVTNPRSAIDSQSDNDVPSHTVINMTEFYTYKHAQRSEVTNRDIKERRDNHTVHTQSGFEYDLSARSELLPNASELTFSPSLKKVIGIDLGEIVTAAVCLLDKDNPNARHSKKVKRNFLYEPTWRFS